MNIGTLIYAIVFGISVGYFVGVHNFFSLVLVAVSAIMLLWWIEYHQPLEQRDPETE